MPDTPYHDSDISRDNREIIRLGKSLLRRHLAALSVERFQDLKVVHDIVSECFEENMKLGGSGGGESLADLIRSIQGGE